MIRTWKRVHRLYERNRELFFKDCETVLPASQLQWEWLAENAPMTGETHLDEDHHPHLVRLHPALRYAERYLEDCLIHEMMHMKLGPATSCRWRSKKWKAEMDRLYALGAIWI